MTKALCIAVGSVLVCFGLSGCGEITEPTEVDGPSFGLAKGREGVTICHKGETITVGGPALRAHVAHGDREGSCDAICSAPGLVSWWPGEGVTDDIANGNHGSLQNGAGFAPGKIGQAFSFDGADDQFTAPTMGLPTGSADRTLMFWTRSPHMDRGNRMLAGWGSGGTGTMSAILLGQMNAPTRIPFFWGWAEDVLALSPLSDDTWYHLAVTVESGGFVRFYIDGIEDASGSRNLNTGTGTTFYMANRSVSDFIYGFEGLIDEVQVYGRALLQSEIEAIVNAGNAGGCEGVNIVN